MSQMHHRYRNIRYSDNIYLENAIRQNNIAFRNDPERFNVEAGKHHTMVL